MEMLASTSNDAPWVSNTVFSDCKVYGSWLFLFSTHYGDGAGLYLVPGTSGTLRHF